MADTKWSLLEIELALADKFDWKRNIVTFNINGWSGKLPIFHECDVLVMTRAGYLTEIEIKRSLVDFKKDFKKEHAHSNDSVIKNFWYCVPAKIYEKCLEFWKDHARFRINGFIVYSDEYDWIWFQDYSVENPPGLPEKKFVKLSDEQMFEVARLGAMRAVTLKRKISRMINKEKES